MLPAGGGDEAGESGVPPKRRGLGRSADGSAAAGRNLGAESGSRKRKATLMSKGSTSLVENRESLEVTCEDYLRIKKEIEDLRSQLDEDVKELGYCEENEKLRVELALKFKETQCLMTQNENMQAKNVGMWKRNEELQAKSDGMGKQHEELQAKNNGLAKQNKELQTNNDGMMNRNMELQAHNGTLTERNEEMQAKNDSLIKWSQELQAKNDDLMKQNKELQTNNDGIMKRNMELQTHNAILTKWNDEMQAKNDDLMKWSQELQANNDGLTKQNEDIQAKNVGLVKQIDELQTKNNIMMKRNGDLQAENGGLMKLNEELQDKNDGQTNRNKELKAKNASLAKQDAELRAKNVGLAKQIEKAQTNNDGLRKRNGELQAKISGLAKQDVELQAKKDILIKKNEELQAKNDSLRKQNEKLQVKNDGLMKRIEELEAKNDGLRKRIEELEAKTDDLPKQNEQLQAKNDDITKWNAELQFKTDGLMQCCEELQAKNDGLKKWNEELHAKNDGLHKNIMEILEIQSDAKRKHLLQLLGLYRTMTFPFSHLESPDEDSSLKVVYASMAEKSGINVKAENKSVASQIIVHYSSGQLESEVSTLDAKCKGKMLRLSDLLEREQCSEELGTVPVEKSIPMNVELLDTHRDLIVGVKDEVTSSRTDTGTRISWDVILESVQRLKQAEPTLRQAAASFEEIRGLQSQVTKIDTAVNQLMSALKEEVAACAAALEHTRKKNGELESEKASAQQLMAMMQELLLPILEEFGVETPAAEQIATTLKELPGAIRHMTQELVKESATFCGSHVLAILKSRLPGLDLSVVEQGFRGTEEEAEELAESLRHLVEPISDMFEPGSPEEDS